MYKVILILDKFFLKYEGGEEGAEGGMEWGGDLPQQEKLPSKSPALTGEYRSVETRIIPYFMQWWFNLLNAVTKVLFMKIFICNFEQLYGNRSSHSKMFRKKISSESFWECPKYYLRNNRETSSRSCQPTMTEVLGENSQWIKTIIYFYKIAPP